MIGDGHYGVLAIIKDDYVARNIQRVTDNDLKITIRYFKYIDGVIKTDLYSQVIVETDVSSKIDTTNLYLINYRS